VKVGVVANGVLDYPVDVLRGMVLSTKRFRVGKSKSVHGASRLAWMSIEPQER
jgi:hypothetical protein